MELLFLGRGAAFNPKEGNNSAFFKEDDNLFLIDCGETVFERLIKYNLLDDIKNIHVFITHTHSDHIGSLPSLISYCYYNKKININIVMDDNLLHKSNVTSILDNTGCPRYTYNYVSMNEYSDKYKLFNSVTYVKTHHTDVIPSYSLRFNTNQGIIFYTGDTDEINIIKELIESDEDIDKLYIDTNTSESNNGHLYIGILDREIPYEYKNKVYSMHVNNDECIEMARGLGFNVVEVYDGNNKEEDE